MCIERPRSAFLNCAPVPGLGDLLFGTRNILNFKINKVYLLLLVLVNKNSFRNTIETKPIGL